MNYQIIKDEIKFRQFIEWLPQLENHEAFFFTLLARKKYNNELPSSEVQLKRFIVRKKEHIFSHVRQLEVPFGSYEYKGQAVPNDCLVLYCTPNPRDLIKTTQQAALKLTKLAFQPYNGYNPLSETVSVAQNCSSRSVFLNYDFDGIEPEEFISAAQTEINMDCINILRTRGGLHALIKPDKIDVKYKKTWYKAISSIRGFDKKVSNAELLSVAGCVQGNYVPSFV